MHLANARARLNAQRASFFAATSAGYESDSKYSYDIMVRTSTYKQNIIYYCRTVGNQYDVDEARYSSDVIPVLWASHFTSISSISRH
jgi:hypothetical protein